MTSPSPVERPASTASCRSRGFDQVRQVIGLGVHVIAQPGLPGAAVAAAVVGDGAVAAGGREVRLVVSRVGVQRLAVAEHDRLPGSQSL